MITSISNYLTHNMLYRLPSPTDCMLWLGNFNCHHPLWEADSNHHLFSSADMMNPLINLITEYDMKMALPPDIPMYQTAASNWTCPDNVWCNNNPADPLVICDIQPSICSPLADHLPIYTELDLPIPRASSITTRNMCDANFTVITNNLKQLLSEHCPAIPIHSKRELDRAVDTLIQCINDVIDKEVPPSKPCPFTKRWWTKELTKLKKEKNRLSRISY